MSDVTWLGGDRESIVAELLDSLEGPQVACGHGFIDGVLMAASAMERGKKREQGGENEWLTGLAWL